MISLKVPRKYSFLLLYQFVHPTFPRNPNKGVIINHPHGDDVYHGVPKDYTGAVGE